MKLFFLFFIIASCSIQAQITIQPYIICDDPDFILLRETHQVKEDTLQITYTAAYKGLVVNKELLRSEIIINNKGVTTISFKSANPLDIITFSGEEEFGYLKLSGAANLRVFEPREDGSYLANRKMVALNNCYADIRFL